MAAGYDVKHILPVGINKFDKQMFAFIYFRRVEIDLKNQ